MPRIRRAAPATGSPPAPRGDATREALLRAALSAFARDGFHAASTREIAATAGANQALIGYHFGGKEGLYLAVCEDIAAQVNQRLGPLAQAIETGLDTASRTPRGAAAAQQRDRHLGQLLQLLDGIAAMLTHEVSEPWAQIIIREQQAPGPAFEALYSGYMARLLALLQALVQRIRPRDSAAGARLRVLTIFGQLLAFRAARATTLHHMGWARIGPAELAAIQQQVRANVRAMLLSEA